MCRASLTVGVVALAGVCAVGAPMVMAASSATADAQATTTLSGSAAPVTSDRLGVDAVRGSRSQTVQVWMAGHQQAAQQFADAVSTPGSPTYHQYLSPSAYTQRFGPSAAQVRAVHSYLSSAGFTKVQNSINDDYVSATAPVSTINQVFSVQMRRYRIRGAGATSATIKSNDRDLTVPTWINSDILVSPASTAPSPRPTTPRRPRARAPWLRPALTAGRRRRRRSPRRSAVSPRPRSPCAATRPSRSGPPTG